MTVQISTATIFTIPVQNVPQQFGISLANTDYLLTVKWNDSPDAGWAMDIADALTSDVIAANIPFITGANLLSGLEYLGIEGAFVVFTDGNADATPTLDNLGVECNLYFLTNVPNG